MLNFTFIGPQKDGAYLVGYQTPGCESFTPVCECRTKAQATTELARLSAQQECHAKRLQDELDLQDRDRIVRRKEAANANHY